MSLYVDIKKKLTAFDLDIHIEAGRSASAF